MHIQDVQDDKMFDVLCHELELYSRDTCLNIIKCQLVLLAN